MMSSLERCETSYGAKHGECARWLLADSLCDREDGHWPDTLHRAHGLHDAHEVLYFTEDDGKAIRVGDVEEEAVTELIHRWEIIRKIGKWPHRKRITEYFDIEVDEHNTVRITYPALVHLLVGSGAKPMGVSQAPAPEQTWCTCGHSNADHIYEEGACRPGFVCKSACAQFTPQVRL